MRKLLLTTAVALPFSFGMAFAQTATTTPPADAAATAAGDAATAAGDAATAAGEAAHNAADATADTAAGAAESAADAADAAGAAADDAADAAADAADAAVDPVAAPADAAAADAAAGDADKAALEAEMAASDKVAREQTAGELRLDWITGASVMSPDGTKVGDIRDLILDGSTGTISAAIIGVGGFLGIGEKQIAVPWDRLTVNYDAREITSDLTKDEAEAAPEYVFRQQESAPAPMDPMAPPADPAAMPADPAAAPADPAAAPADPAAAPATN